MISKIYGQTKYKRMFQAGRGKGRKRPNRSKAYREAAAMSRLTPSIKRVVTYKIKKKINEQ